jgi:hypothetical protein
MKGTSDFTVLCTLGPLATKRFVLGPLTGEVKKTAYGSAKWRIRRAGPRYRSLRELQGLGPAAFAAFLSSGRSGGAA